MPITTEFAGNASTLENTVANKDTTEIHRSRNTLAIVNLVKATMNIFDKKCIVEQQKFDCYRI